MKKETKLLNASYPEDIDIAVCFLQEGELVAVPTETVYGLAANAQNPEAVKKIFIAKNRPDNHPLIVHIASSEDLSQWAENVSPQAIILAKHFWPGPLTLVLKKADCVSDVITGGLKTIAIRVPQNLVLLEILRRISTGLAAPSANLHKRISPTTAQHVMTSLAGKIAAVLDDGPCTIGLESTIVDMTSPTPKIVRPGPITQKMLEDVLQLPVVAPSTHTNAVPGNMLIHYQPQTETSLMSTEAIKDYVTTPKNKNKKYAVMHFSPLTFAENSNIILQKMPLAKACYAAMMYKTMHELDALGIDEIIIETPPQTDDWQDICDRLFKAGKKK